MAESSREVSSNGSAEGRNATAFWCMVALLPLLFFPGWGVSFISIKYVGLGLIVSLCLWLQRKRTQHAVYVWGLVMLGLYALVTALRVENWALAFHSLLLSSALWVIPFFIASIESAHTVLKSFRYLLPAILISLLSAFVFIFWREVLFLTETPFGGTIGLRNSLPIFLTQTIPLCLYFLVRRGATKWTLQELLLFVLLIAELWVVISYRTRSAWWMLIVYLVILCSFSIRNLPQLRRAFLLLGCALGIAATLAATVPTDLKWRSSQPYLDSVSTLGSFKHSSGRVQLWQVGIAMVTSRPLTGIGAGQYPANWPEAIALSGVHPKKFGFLRFDLPLFNDYLQSAVESGIIVAVLFAAWVVGLPLLYIVLALRSRMPWTVEGALAFCLCFGTCMNALIESPFQRPESTLLFSIALGVLLREVLRCVLPAALPATLPVPPQSSTQTRWRSIFVSLFMLFLGAQLVRMTLSQSLRLLNETAHSPALISLAIAVWKGEIGWNRTHILQLQEQRNYAGAEQLARENLRHWPHHPESYVMWGLVLEQSGKSSESLAAFERGTKAVPGGRSYRSGKTAYLQFLARDTSGGALIKKRSSADQSAPPTVCKMPEIVSGKMATSSSCPFIAISSNRLGAMQPFLVSGEGVTSTVTRLSVPLRKDFYVREVSSDCTSVVLLGDHNGDEQFQVYLYNLKLQTLTLVSRRGLRNAGDPHFSPQGSLLAYSSGRKVYGYDLLRGKDSFSFAVPQKVSALAWSHDSSKIFIQDTEGVLWNYEVSSKELATLWKPPRKLFSKSALASDAEHLYFVSDHEGDFSKIYTISFSTGDVAPLIRTSANEDQGDPLVTNEGVYYRRAVSTKVCLGYTESGSLNQSSYRSEVPCDGVLFDYEPMGAGGAHLLYSNVSLPLSLYLRRQSGQFIERLGITAPQVLHAPKEVVLSPPSEIAVPHLLFEPSTPTTSVVFWLHGGPAENVSPRYNPFIANLVAAGHAVFAVNYMGSTGAGNQYELRGVPFQKQLEMQSQNLVQIVEQFGVQFPKYSAYTVLGVSYGANLAHRIVNELPGRFSRMVDFSGRTDLFEGELEKFGHLTTLPTLYLSGEHDPMQTTRERREMHRRAKQSPAVKWEKLVGEGHVIRSRENNQRACDALVGFIGRLR